MISRLALESKSGTQVSEATEFPNIPFDEYRTCHFRPWSSSDLIYVTLNLVYGAFFPLPAAHSPAFNPFFVKGVLALLIIVYSAKRRDGGFTRVGGVPGLLDKILRAMGLSFYRWGGTASPGRKIEI